MKGQNKNQLLIPNAHTVNHKYNNYYWDPNIVAVLDRWPLFVGKSILQKLTLGFYNGGLCSAGGR